MHSRATGLRSWRGAQLGDLRGARAAGDAASRPFAQPHAAARSAAARRRMPLALGEGHGCTRARAGRLCAGRGRGRREAAAGAMDGGGGYRVELGFRPGRALRVDFCAAAHARVRHGDDKVEAAAAARWARAARRNPRLFNGGKFRFAGVDEADGGTALVRLGLTDYAEFQGTHSAEGCVRVFGEAGLARPFGNAVFCETADGFVPFLVRCAGVGEGAGRAVMPGGHPEPGEVAGVLDGGSVARELLAAAVREVSEELFVGAGRLDAAGMAVLGIVSREEDLKPIAAFALRVRATRAEVVRGYVEGNVAQEESVKLVMVRVGEVEALWRARCLPSGERIMPDHLGCLELVVRYLAWRDGGEGEGGV